MEEKRNIGLSFKKVKHMIGRCLHARLAECGFDEVSIMHGWILGYLYDNSSHPVCQKDIEDEFEIGKSSVTGILKLMEKKGYVSRTVDDKDARHKIISLTPLGIKVQQDTMDIIDRFHEQLEEGITSEEKDNFFIIVDKICNNLNTMKKEGNKKDD